MGEVSLAGMTEPGVPGLRRLRAPSR